MDKAATEPLPAASRRDTGPIHAPGAVQPHAAFLAIDLATGAPCAASRSLAAWAGRPVEALWGAQGLTIFDASSVQRLSVATHGGAGAPLDLRLAGGRRLTGWPGIADDLLMIDLETQEDPRVVDAALMRAESAMRRIQDAGSLDALCTIMVDTARDITGLERGLVVRFDASWSGEVIADSGAEAGPAPFLGLRFPERDVPAPVRALLLRNRVRHIAEVGAPASPIVPAMHPRTGQPLDLSALPNHAVLPTDVEDLLAMGVQTHLAIALVRRGQLWGLVVCHNYAAPRVLSALLRAVCGLLGEAFSSRLGTLLDAAHAAALAALDDRLAPLEDEAEAIAAASQGTGLGRFMEAAAPTLLDALRARSFCAWIGHDEICIGERPSEEEMADIMVRARMPGAGGRGGVLCGDSLPPLPSGAARTAASYAYLRSAAGRDGALALRAETIVTETWARDPDRAVSTPDTGGAQHPRANFRLWQVERRGRSLPWTETDHGALRVVRNHVVHWRRIFDRARREALIQHINASRAEARRLALVAERANDAVIVTDAQGLIVWANAGFERLSGYALHEVRGRKPGDVLQGPETDRDTTARIGRFIAAGQPVRATLINYSKDGRPYWIEMEITPVLDADGQPQQFIAIERDVTDARAREAALEEAVRRAQESDRLKDEFLRMISHEIRTPLNGIIGGIAVLINGLHDERRVEMGRHVAAAGQRLLDMFSDMLDLARSRSGAAPVCRESVAPGSLVEAALASVRAEAERRHLAAEVDAGSDYPDVPLDRASVGRILARLADNAVKHTQSGWVRLRALAPRREGAVVRFEVEDSGPGIPEAMRGRIFEPFSQIDGSHVRRAGGLGLGLAVSRLLAEEMGGAVGVDTAPGGGALFWLEV